MRSDDGVSPQGGRGSPMAASLAGRRDRPRVIASADRVGPAKAGEPTEVAIGGAELGAVLDGEGGDTLWTGPVLDGRASRA